MRVNDALIGVALLLVALPVFLYARTLPAIPGQDYGAAVFPVLIAAGLSACGALLVASGLRRWQGVAALDPWARSPGSWAKLAAVFGLVLLCTLALDRVGFAPLSVLTLVVLMRVAGARWIVALPAALAATILIQQIFRGLLKVPLPAGILGP
jgi:putative tricarboxylic transport membrane protein